MKNLKSFISKLSIVVLQYVGYKRIHFIHIGKTGGSAIRSSFAESANRNKKFVISKPYIFQMNGHGFKFTDLKEHEMVFFVVRDPISRFVSSFYSRKREGKPKNYNPWSEVERISFGLFETPNDLAEGLTSEDCNIKQSALNAMNGIGHVKNHYWDWFQDEETLRRGVHKVFFVLRQETLTSDFEVFCKRFNLKLHSLPDDPIKSHRNPLSSRASLSHKALENLRDWYSSDYRFLEILEELKLFKI